MIFKICLFLLLMSCKVLPQNMRTQSNDDSNGAAAKKLLKDGSIQFTRTGAGTGGELTFELLDASHKCRVQYWTDDPTGKPPRNSPMVVDCPESTNTAIVKIAIDGISKGFPLSFRIFLWPNTLTFEASVSLDWKEEDGGKTPAGHLVVSRFNYPRYSNEIYTYQFPAETVIADVKKAVADKYENGKCSENDNEDDIAFPRSKSLEDKSNRPLHGLSDVVSNGFAREAAETHPFFKTRLTQTFQSVETKENWQWNFNWEGQSYSFAAPVPSSMAEVSMIAESATTLLDNRYLGNALNVIDVGKSPFVLKTKLVSAPSIGGYRLTVQTADASKTIVRCTFSSNQRDLAIPASSYQKIANGEYLVTLVLESSYVHVNSAEKYPPWLITSQDWIHFKINKKL